MVARRFINNARQRHLGLDHAVAYFFETDSENSEGDDTDAEAALITRGPPARKRARLGAGASAAPSTRKVLTAHEYALLQQRVFRARAQSRAEAEAELHAVIQRLHAHVLADNAEQAAGAAAGAAAASSTAAAAPAPTATAPASCSICLADLGGDGAVVTSAACGHSHTCAGCLARWLRAKLDEGHVPPWPRCPALGCTADICPAALRAAGASAAAGDDPSDPSLLEDVVLAFLGKHLVRFPEWMPCPGSAPGQEHRCAVTHGAGTSAARVAASGSASGFASGPASASASSAAAVPAPAAACAGAGLQRGARAQGRCPGGFFVGAPGMAEGARAACACCGTAATLRQPAGGSSDEELSKMVAAGTMRGCPACRAMAFKEKGVCNVINCAQCGIWWNWRTLETGRSSRELKDRARASGTLWEPGELAFQQKLQRTDLPAFKALLERNGVRYDPRYVRGT
eukprot:g3292.t1